MENRVDQILAPIIVVAIAFIVGHAFFSWVVNLQ
jgi:hypothetical protein